MNYRPDPNQLILWDTWMYPEPEDRRMHLFFLATRSVSKPYDRVGHAVSEDLVHWQDLPTIPLRRPEDTYDVGTIGTGMVFAYPTGGFQMTYTVNLEGPHQGISFLHSRDLIHWEKRGQEPCILAQAPYYETDATKCVCRPPAFRDAYIHRVGDHYEALISAHVAQGPPLLRGCIARYKSTDPELRRWEPSPPLIGPSVTTMMEVPEHFQMGGKHYLLWSTVFWVDAACDTRTRRQCVGTFYALSDSYEGPYSVPEDNLLIGSGGGCVGDTTSYVGRTIMWRGERLLYHLLGSPWPSAAFPKRIIQEKDGTLKTAWWPGVEAIHIGEVSLSLDKIAIQGENLHVGEWKTLGNSGLIGSIDGGGNLGLVPADLEDAHLRCNVTLQSGTRFGVTMRDVGHAKSRKVGESKGSKGVALQGDVRWGQWQFGTPEHSWYSRIDPTEVIFEAPQIGRTYRVDLIVREIYFEAYIDGIWKFTRIIPDRSRRGGIGFFVEDGTARFEDIRVWNLEPLRNVFPEPWPIRQERDLPQDPSVSQKLRGVVVF